MKERLYRSLLRYSRYLDLIVENAGRSAAAHVLRHWPGATLARVLLGPSFRLNAIALSAARHLAAKGLSVEVLAAEASAEEAFRAPYNGQLAVIGLYPRIRQAREASFARPAETAVLDGSQRGCLLPEALASVVYLEGCGPFPRSSCVFFDPYIAAGMAVGIKGSLSPGFLLDSAIPPDMLSIPADAFKSDFEARIKL